MNHGKATEEQLKRAARNQSIFREVNEKLEGLAENFQAVSETAQFTCECADLGCIAMIDLTLNEYEAVRKNPNRFVVLPGHVYPEFERVVSETERYVLVAKHDEGGELAEDLNPRK
jgi:5-bromo-4-chloroindolyl phosphate hydrolysis protein